MLIFIGMKNKALFFVPFLWFLLNAVTSAALRADEPARPAASHSDSSSPVIAVPSAGEKPDSPSAAHPQKDAKDLGEEDFPLIRPGFKMEEMEVWELSDGSKAFMDMRQKKATLIEPNGDRKVYNKVQGTPAEDLEPIIKQPTRELFGKPIEKIYADGSSDYYLSRELMATLDSSRRLIDLTLSDGSNDQSLLASMNLARHDLEAINSARSVIKAAASTDLSHVPSDLRAQIAETLRTDLSLLQSTISAGDSVSSS